MSRRIVAGLGLGSIAAALIAGNVSAQEARPIRLVAFGDSLTAGYGLPPAAAFPIVLEKAVSRPGRPVSIANAGVSGDTASAGLERLDWSIADGTQGVIVELGANDALRGLDPDITRKAIDQIVRRLTERRIAVLLAGMLAPPNLGQAFGEKFGTIFPDVAKKYDAMLYPFFLDGVAGDRRLNLPDGIHPTVEGVKIIVEKIKPTVEQFIDKIAQRA